MDCNCAWLVIVTIAWFAFPAVAADQPEVLAGRLTQQDGFSVLEVWGSPAESGFAQGYLLAERVLGMFDATVLDPRIGTSPEMYDAVMLPAVRRTFVWAPRFEQELEGILRGMRARLGPDRVVSEKLGRPLTLDDLKLVNTLADWRGAFCSSFVAWGSLTVDGQPLTGRNLDFPATESMRKNQIVLIHRGAQNRRAWIGVTWPTLIGVYTGMNAEGITIAMHDAAGLPTTNPAGVTPRSLALREALELAGPSDWFAQVENVLKKRRCLVGNNVMVSAPPRADQPVACVFEYDGNDASEGVTRRLTKTNEPALPEALWCTNHMRTRREAEPCDRYARLSQRLHALAGRKQRLTARSALDTILLVANQTTLHSVVFVPVKRQLVVNIPAIQSTAVQFDVDDWLKRPTGLEAQP